MTIDYLASQDITTSLQGYILAIQSQYIYVFWNRTPLLCTWCLMEVMRSDSYLIGSYHYDHLYDSPWIHHYVRTQLQTQEKRRSTLHNSSYYHTISKNVIYTRDLPYWETISKLFMKWPFCVHLLLQHRQKPLQLSRGCWVIVYDDFYISNQYVLYG